MLNFKCLKLLSILSSMVLFSCWDYDPIDDENAEEVLFADNKSEEESFSEEKCVQDWKNLFLQLKGENMDIEKFKFLNNTRFGLKKNENCWTVEVNGEKLSLENFSPKDIGYELGLIERAGGTFDLNLNDFCNNQAGSAIVVSWLNTYEESRLFDDIRFTDSAKLGLTIAEHINTIHIEELGDCDYESFVKYCNIIKKLNLQKQCDLFSLISFDEKPVFDSSLNSNLSSTSSSQEFDRNKPFTKFGDKSVDGFVKNPQDLNKLAGYLKLFLESDDISCCDDGKCLLFNQEIKIQFCK